MPGQLHGQAVFEDRAGDAICMAADKVVRCVDGLVFEGHWQALAITGGAPCDLVVVWDGEALELLALHHDGRFTPLEVQ